MEEFGPHITLDLKGCPKEVLSDYNLHFDYLKSLPGLIHMTPITQPYVFPYSGLVPEDKGIPHFVGHIAPNVKHIRYSITGWFD
jgi:S-adenosylmethionine decarboxylase